MSHKQTVALHGMRHIYYALVCITYYQLIRVFIKQIDHLAKSKHVSLAPFDDAFTLLLHIWIIHRVIFPFRRLLILFFFCDG